jgi:sugar/nucleoside kinase (ribokinase family)
MLELVPIVALTRGWEGMDLMTRDAVHSVPTLPRPEVDPTGAGDVFAAAFLVRYQETGDPLEAAAFASCAASCVVEGVGTTSLGDRGEVEKRMRLRERMIEEGEWED